MEALDLDLVRLAATHSKATEAAALKRLTLGDENFPLGPWGVGLVISEDVSDSRPEKIIYQIGG